MSWDSSLKNYFWSPFHLQYIDIWVNWKAPYVTCHIPFLPCQHHIIIYATKFDWMPTVPGTLPRACETPVKKQRSIGGAYICNCYSLKLFFFFFFPINHAASAAKHAGVLEKHSRVRWGLTKYYEWSIRLVPRNMTSNLYGNVLGPVQLAPTVKVIW